jgi:hypothetical protein
VRAVEVLAVVAFLVACALIVRATWRAARRELPTGDWEPFHRFEGSCRRVYVRRGEELEPVGEIAPADPDYDDAFLALMDRARERAAVLNSERSPRAGTR